MRTVTSVADIRNLGDGWYILTVGGADGLTFNTGIVPVGAVSMPVNWRRTDCEILFYKGYPVTTATLYCVFLNNNG